MIPLKDAIDEKHRIAEQMMFNQRMFRGELSPYEYGMYLHQLLQVFGTIERYMVPHVDLNRSAKILKDISELKLSEPLYILETTQYYKTYLLGLKPEELLPHIYLHYLALMFGGQMMKDKVIGSGHIYEFNNMRDCMTSIRAIQLDSWADEVNKGLDYFIDILDELQHISRFSR